jgi:FMN phosphatase YigB (HAD superfamily)
MNIQAIVFDVFGTLVEIAQPNDRFGSCFNGPVERQSKATVPAS